MNNNKDYHIPKKNVLSVNSRACAGYHIVLMKESIECSVQWRHVKELSPIHGSSRCAYNQFHFIEITLLYWWLDFFRRNNIMTKLFLFTSVSHLCCAIKCHFISVISSLWIIKCYYKFKKSFLLQAIKDGYPGKDLIGLLSKKHSSIK